MPEDKIQWHPVFATALQLELQDYLQALEIQEEHQLTSKPLEIDILIIKKIKDVQIIKNIAQIFKGHNIVEYKSPDDYICIDDYYKVKAYAYIYKTLGKHVDERKIDDLTITMVSSGFPEKMIQHITHIQKVSVVKQSDGIYYLEGEDIKSQVIVVDELLPRENRYIRLLTRRMNIKDEISTLFTEYENNRKDSRYEMLVNAVISTNLLQVMEVYGMGKTLTKEVQEAVESVVLKFNLNSKWEREGEIRGKLEGEIEGELRGEIISLLRILTKKFGTLPNNFIEKIRSLKDKQLIETILDNIFEISSLEELEKYLNS